MNNVTALLVFRGGFLAHHFLKSFCSLSCISCGRTIQVTSPALKMLHKYRNRRMISKRVLGQKKCPRDCYIFTHFSVDSWFMQKIKDPLKTLVIHKVMLPVVSVFRLLCYEWLVLLLLVDRLCQNSGWTGWCLDMYEENWCEALSKLSFGNCV